jgi:outer membrane protein assembly factor BamB
MDCPRFPHYPFRLLCTCLLLFLVSCSLAAGPMGTNATTSRAASSAMFGIDAEHTHFTSNEHIITYANASRLVPDWTSFATGGSIIESSPAVAGGVVFTGSDDGSLYAFDETGCGSPPCSPLWTSPPAGDAIYSSPAVANGVVYAGSLDHKLYAFHLHGTIP